MAFLVVAPCFPRRLRLPSWPATPQGRQASTVAPRGRSRCSGDGAKEGLDGEDGAGLSSSSTRDCFSREVSSTASSEPPREVGRGQAPLLALTRVAFRGRRRRRRGARSGPSGEGDEQRADDGSR